MKISREFKIGLVATVTLALFVYGLNFLKGKNLLSPTNSYYMTFDNIYDLKESAFVNMYGMKVGIVTNLKIDQKNSKGILVKVDVEKGLKIPNNSTAELYAFDILGTKAIRFIAGNAAESYKHGDTIPSFFSPGLNENMDEILDNIQKVVANLNDASNQVAAIFSGENADKIEGSIDDLSSVSREMNTMISSPQSDLNKSIASLESTLAVIKRKQYNNRNNFT
jgi:phospholipid/cholesterol/gamma-HCH transport system substrate-binding protein